ncbi:MAG: DNA N-6-adenine-methyltransferase [Anaerolineaceae bacterium]|nr:DNA N-6-adenine-methyltransferase [Anaerolineaceae bacterium]
MNDKWATPPELRASLHAEFNFTDDPCPIDWAADTHADALTTSWGQRNFVNPPYSKVAAFLRKAHEESKAGKLCVCLVNAITDTRAFHDTVVGNPHAEVRFIKGRVKFIKHGFPEAPRTPNPKPSIIIVFRPPPAAQ